MESPKKTYNIQQKMDGAVYLMNYGWTQGEALKMGGLKKPILVKHKKDQKGLGHNADQQEAWWERVFDGQLKSLDVNTGSSSSGVSFTQREVKVSGMSKNVSPLYRMFRYGGILEGSIKEAKVSIIEKKEKTLEPAQHKSEKKKSKKSSKSRNDKEKDKSSRKKDKESKKESSSAKKVKKSGKVGKEHKLKSEKSKKPKTKTADQIEADWVNQIMAQVNQSIQIPA